MDSIPVAFDVVGAQTVWKGLGRKVKAKQFARVQVIAHAAQKELSAIIRRDRARDAARRKVSQPQPSGAKH